MEKWRKNVNFSNVEYNKTTLYLLPACGLKMEFKTLRSFGFVNCYIDWKDCHEKNEHCLYFLFSPGKEYFSQWNLFYILYSKMDTFVKDYYIDFGVIVICFKLKTNYWLLPKYMMSGKYSMFPKEYRRHFTVSQGENLLQYDVLTKSEKLRRSMEDALGYKEGYLEGKELASIPDEKSEILDYVKLKDKWKLSMQKEKLS